MVVNRNSVKSVAVAVKTTPYFDSVRKRPDRAAILESWIVRVIEHPEVERPQSDERIRRWARIDQAGGKWLRVVLLGDRETVHNAFFDRRFRP